MYTYLQSDQMRLQENPAHSGCPNRQIDVFYDENLMHRVFQVELICIK